MKHIAYPLALSLLSLLMSQLASAQEIKFQFQHEGTNVSGFNLWMSESGSLMTIIKSAHNPSVREFTYQWVRGEDEKCFGVSSYTSLAESEVVTTQIDGTPLCVGKRPAPPTGFTYSVQ